MRKKILAIVLAIMTVMTSIPIEGMAAQETVLVAEENSEAENNGEAEVSTEANKKLFNETQKETGNAESGNVGTEQTTSTKNGDSKSEKTESTEEGNSGVKEIENTGNENSESVEIAENQDAELPERGNESAETEDSEGTDGAEERYLIKYLMVNQKNVSIDEVQQVVLGIDCDMEIKEAVLYYYKQDCEETLEQSCTEVIDGAILFEILFDDLNQTGVYQLDSVAFSVDGKVYTESFSNAGIEAVFGMNVEIEAASDAVLDDGTIEEIESEMDIVRIDEEGNTVSETSLEAAIESARAEQPATFKMKRSGEIVVVLDPGHDETHAGAQHNGLAEEELNLKIALYCKEELETYQRIKVYLTRESDGACPYMGTTAGKCNEKRVAYAQEVGADIYVSLHNNSSSSTSANGAMVFYPNKNYNSSASSTGKDLAEQIQDQLVDLGLYNRGITVKDSADYKYPDGSTADYYAVIRNSKKVGIPAIIVEHAFVSNVEDVNNYLNSEKKVKALGVADATAIASYYGLTREANVTADSIQVSVTNNNKGIASMKAMNIAPVDEIEKVSFAVWSTSDQRDLYWYNVKNDGTGNYEATLDISNHQDNYAEYFVDVYAYDIYGKCYYIGGKTCGFTEPSAKITVVGNDLQTNYKITAANVVLTGKVQSVNIAVWSQNGGQDDLIWYKATEDSPGVYVIDVPIKNHKTAGVYYVDTYATRTNGTRKYVGGTKFQVTEPSVGKIQIVNKNVTEGTFDVVLTDVQTVSGVSKVQIPVWSRSDQSDLYWYVAKQQADGSYIANISLKNHKYNYGEFYVDIYVTAVNGVHQCISSQKVAMKIPTATIQAVGNAKQTSYKLTIPDVWLQSSVKSIRFAVWSQMNGQDDLKWYNATLNLSGAYEVDVPITSHKTAGLYYVDAYMIGINGTRNYVGGTTFNITVPSVEKIEIVNKDDGAGTFKVVLTGMQPLTGVSKVQIPVWCKSDQSDLYWYTAKKQSDGNYVVDVNLANHKYSYGKYYVDVYITTMNGVRECVGGRTVTMTLPKAKITALPNVTQTNYAIEATDVGIPGGIKLLKFAVWSLQNGQDDLVWYIAKNEGLGKWTSKVIISNHRTSGKYYVDAYAISASGENVYLGGNSFNVDMPVVSSVELIDYNEQFGTFGVEITGVQSVSGIKNVEVAVWSTANQSDLVWYNAVLVSEDTYQINVDIKNHQNNTGKYYADAYLTTKNGIRIYAGGFSCSITNVTKSIGFISSCEIASGSKKEMTINLDVDLEKSAENFDAYYIAQIDSYDGTVEKVWTSKEGSNGSSTVNIAITGEEQVKSALMDKFTLAVKDSAGNLVFSSNSLGISNPEAIAVNTAPIFKGSSKKGLQGIYYATYDGGDDILEARNANTKQTLINLDLASVVTTNPNKAGYKPYTYKGNTYYFSELSALKANVRSLNIGYKQYLNGNSETTPVAVTLCLLLSYNSENSFLIDPSARTPGRAYYTLNVREEYARETLEALFFYLGETFGQSDCYVSNWILGNEINSSKAWNYSGSLDFDTYMDCYATAFRMLYTGVKSEKTGNTVSISLDNGWTAAPDTYAGKTTLDTFAKKIDAQNPNVEWSIAYHPYSYPLTRVDFWNDYKNTTDSLSTPYISMRNINVLTNYVGTLESTYGKKAGSIRVLLTEQGYSYSGGAENQAMAIARGYYIAEFNDRIDAFIIRAVVDDADEASGKLYFGLMNSQHEKRIAFYVYEFMDSSRSGFASQSSSIVSDENRSKFEAAKSIVCNTNWSSIVLEFDDSKLAAIK